MTPEVKKALEFLTGTYGNLKEAARSWQLNPQEVHEALKEAKENTPEHYVLTLLASYNPLPDATPKKTVAIKDVTKSEAKE